MKRFVVVVALAAVVSVALVATQAPAVTTKNVADPLRLNIVGNGAKCDLKTGTTFRFKVTGSVPGHSVMILVFYPRGFTDPVYSNPEGFYWFHQNFGIYTVPSTGVVLSKSWDCRYGPNGTKDPAGKYTAGAIDLSNTLGKQFVVK